MIKRCIYLLLAVCAYSLNACSQTNSEEILVNKVLVCLQHHDDSSYAALFPSAHLLTARAMSLVPITEQDKQRIANIQSDTNKLAQFDARINTHILDDFDSVYKKGKDSGVHWSDILLVRYELEKMVLQRSLIGFEKIAAQRLQGYIYIQDLLTRRTYVIAVTNIFSIADKWYGGRTVNILEADNVDAYFEKLAAERKIAKEKLLAQLYPDEATVQQPEKTASPENTNVLKQPSPKKEAKDDEEDEDQKKAVITPDVLERKVYVGKLDNEIPVILYVRSLKGSCPEGACAWQAIYKFGDVDNYIKLDVTKTPDGKWQFTEEDVGIMELTLKNGRFTGTWTSFKDKTEYDAVLCEKKEVKNKQLFQLDDILENGDDSGDDGY